MLQMTTFGLIFSAFDFKVFGTCPVVETGDLSTHESIYLSMWFASLEGESTSITRTKMRGRPTPPDRGATGDRVNKIYILLLKDNSKKWFCFAKKPSGQTCNPLGPARADCGSPFIQTPQNDPSENSNPRECCWNF